MNFLVNAYFAKNLGDDLFLKILFDRYPKVNWYLLTSNRDYESIFHKYDNVRVLKSLSINVLGLKKVDFFTKVNEIFTKYRKYDGLINIGGSIFIEGRGWREGLENRTLLPKRLKRINKNSFIIGANFGPFTDDSFIKKYIDFFTYFKDVCFRDRYSYNLFKNQNNVRLAPDVVLNLEKSKFIAREKSIGFSLINLQERDKLSSYKQLYNRKMIEMIEYYIELDYKVKLFSFCEKEGDLIICNDIKKQIKGNFKSDVEIINYNGNIDKFLIKFQKCEMIVGTRFHSIILALRYGQDVLPIAYSDKTYNMLMDLELDDFCYSIKDMDYIRPDYIDFCPGLFQERKIYKEAQYQFKELDLYINQAVNIF